MIAVLAVIGIVVVSTLCVATIKIKRSFPVKYARRNDIRKQFTAFAESNGNQILTTATVARFMHDTADTSSYFSSIDILSLRNELQDSAQLLIHFQDLAGNPETSTQDKSELVNHQNETAQWFEESIARIEALFEAKIILNPTATDVFKELLNTLSRAVRA